MTKKARKEEEEIEEADDWCFECKDGGDLIICDHKGCLKVYHAECVKKDDSSVENEKMWTCGRHTCFICQKSTKIYCFCCPHAICGRCDSAAKFASVKGNGGFCNECLKYILLIEENMDCDSDGAELDFENRETYEGLFKEYWDIIKDREGLTLENVYAADVLLKKGKNYRRRSVAAKICNDEESDASLSDSDEEDTRKRQKSRWKKGKNWDIIKDREGLTLKNVDAADGLLKKGKNYGHRSVAAKICSDEESDASLSDSYEDDTRKRKKGRRKKPALQNKSSAVQGFERWGSKILIAFLNSIGQDTTKQLLRCDVESIISRYIQENNLFVPGQKRKVKCDEKLYSVFRKRMLNRHKIYSLLEDHFIDSAELSDEDEDEDETIVISEEKEENKLGFTKPQITSGYKRKCQEEVVQPKKPKNMKTVQRKLKDKEVVRRKSKEKKVPPEVQESCSAAITAANIKLIYLRRSLVEKILEQLETAEDKIVGSFVKVKKDATNYLQENSHQLMLVTGVTKYSTGDINGEVLLHISNMPHGINLSQLSDADLSEDDCEGLRQRVENGVVEKPNVVELLHKARSLHEDITKHWIEKELVRLQYLIDQANEKGRRRELFQYLEQRELLRKPAEQQRLLKQQPKVIPESLQTKPSHPSQLSSSSSFSSSSSHSSSSASVGS